MATDYLSKCYVAEESDAKLVIKGKRLGGLVGFVVLFIWGFPMVAAENTISQSPTVIFSLITSRCGPVTGLFHKDLGVCDVYI